MYPWIFTQGKSGGLIGENGSGKSTLSNIISGQLLPDEGKMYIQDKEYKPNNNIDAKNNGIGMIIQEMGTINGLTVAANIFLGKEDLFKNSGGLINTKKMYSEAKRILQDIGIDYIRSDEFVDRLGFEDRKIVEMARAMYLKPNVLIVDETTTALSQRGRDILYNIMENMRKQGKTIIFISHDLDEIIDKCDTISVMRDGRTVGTYNVSELTKNKIRSLMVGREIGDAYYRSDYDASYSDDVVMECNDIRAGILKNVSLKLHKGEILGVAGLTDSGIHDIGKVLFGLIAPSKGYVVVRKNGREVKINKPATAIRSKVGYVSKNRDQEALMLLSSIKDNITLPSLDLLKKGFIIRPSNEKKFAKKAASDLNVKMRDINQYVMYLSGGNKQKVVLSKWIANGSEILILDCPTRGIDVGVKAAIYKLMQEMKKEGKAILMISEELPEIIGMSDRILVFKDGEIKHEFLRSQKLSETDIIEYMI